MICWTILNLVRDLRRSQYPQIEVSKHCTYWRYPYGRESHVLNVVKMIDNAGPSTTAILES